VVSVFIPFFLIVTSNIVIIVGIRRAASERNKMAVSTTCTLETHLTRMLILVSLAFIILCLPYGITQLVLSVPSVATLYDYTKLYWRIRVNLTMFTIYQVSLINHSVNFYLYVLGGGKIYRNDVKRVFSCSRH
jgi:hypothetical protein